MDRKEKEEEREGFHESDQNQAKEDSVFFLFQVLSPLISTPSTLENQKPIQVYHVPKTAELNIEGMTGTVADVVKFFKVREREREEEGARDRGPRPFLAPPSHSRPPPPLSLPRFS